MVRSFGYSVALSLAKDGNTPTRIDAAVGDCRFDASSIKTLAFYTTSDYSVRFSATEVPAFRVLRSTSECHGPVGHVREYE
jgi:hypothetical protein